MIQFDNVTKRYTNGHEGLRNINFHIDQGEMVFLTGHSGAGKTTILNIITLLEAQTHGDVRIFEQNTKTITTRKIPHLRRKIGYVGQNTDLLLEHTVYDNVSLPLRVTGNDGKETPRRVRAALDKVNLLNKEKMITASLSSGEQQRIGIARAIVNRPDILLADEPTGNLDHDLSLEILQLFRDFNHFGTTVLFATHDIDMIKQLSYRQLTLQQGRLVSGSSHDIR